MLWTGLNLFLGWWLHGFGGCRPRATLRCADLWLIRPFAELLVLWVGSKLWRMRQARRDLATTAATAP
jgi:hypothetical protein